MMGKAHSLSGAAIWLAGTATYQVVTQQVMDPSIVLMGTIVFAGAALFPDLDSYTSTVTRSYGIFGRMLYYLINGLSLVVYNITKSHRDKDIENGHRTFMHTAIAAILTGLGVFGLTSLPGHVALFGKDFTIGQVCALVIMAFFLHLGTAGLFQKKIKKIKNGFAIAPYILMAFSLAITALFAIFFMKETLNYTWLAFTVTGGILVHIFGDLITKMGVPLLWPIPIRGKRWYDICLPTPLRIKAGGDFEVRVLTPIFYLLITVGLLGNILLSTGLLNNTLGIT